MRREWEQIKCSTHLFRSNDVKWNTQWPLTKGKYSNWIELVLCCCQCLYISKAHLVVGFLSVDDCVCVCMLSIPRISMCGCVCTMPIFFYKNQNGELHTKCWSNVVALKLGSIIVMMKSNVENVQTEMERETRLDRQTQMQNIVKLWVNKRRRWCMCVYSRRWNEKSIEKKALRNDNGIERSHHFPTISIHILSLLLHTGKLLKCLFVRHIFWMLVMLLLFRVYQCTDMRSELFSLILCVCVLIW